MSKKKVFKETDKPTMSEYIGRKLIDRAIHKRSKNQEVQEPQEHDHHHEHDHSYIAMILDEEVMEVVNVGGILKDTLLSQPRMILIDEKEYATRPTIGWKYIDEKFISPEESK